MINRRQFLLGLATIGAVSALPFTPLFSKNKQWFASACSDKKGAHFVAAFDISGQLISKIPLPARGHDVIAMNSKPGHALIFARRPGNFIFEVDFVRGEVVQHIKTYEGQNFYGHGVLIDNDNTLITTENDYKRGKGLIVLRDRITQQIIEQYDSGGIGPHQLAVMPNTNEKQIVIANGGIKTHPEKGREKLNVDTMQPNLAYIDLKNGHVIDSYGLTNKHLSIRHLDVSASGKVIAGLQYQGSSDEVPLAISHHGERELQHLKADMNIWRSMKRYTASVCVNSKSNLVAITCPKANLITYWALDSDTFIASHKLKDGAGVALAAEQFISSTGRGRVITHKTPDTPYKELTSFNDLRWDNHMASLLGS